MGPKNFLGTSRFAQITCMSSTNNLTTSNYSTYLEEHPEFVIDIITCDGEQSLWKHVQHDGIQVSIILVGFVYRIVLCGVFDG